MRGGGLGVHAVRQPYAKEVCTSIALVRYVEAEGAQPIDRSSLNVKQVFANSTRLPVDQQAARRLQHGDQHWVGAQTGIEAPHSLGVTIFIVDQACEVLAA